jgi:hypothetical protein
VGHPVRALVETVVRNSNFSDFLLNFHRDFTNPGSRNSAVGVVTRLLAAQVTNRDSVSDSGTRLTYLLQSLQTSSGFHGASHSMAFAGSFLGGGGGNKRS